MFCLQTEDNLVIEVDSNLSSVQIIEHPANVKKLNED